MNGIVILNKEKGISSNTACRKVGKLLGEKKVGHLGTLDVLATGVLPVALGKATKLFDFYLQKTKTYLATFTFGYETTTLDSEGEVVASSDIIPKEDELRSALLKFIGTQNQMPPKYSAKKINGQCAYDLARSNVDFELKPKEITIYGIELISQISNDTYTFKITCSSGTYIRSIARDLGYALNTYATMTDLVRLQCGNFTLENAYTIAQIEKLGKSVFLDFNTIFKDFEKINVDDIQKQKLLNGQSILIDIEQNAVNIVVQNNNEVLGLGDINNNYLKLNIHLKEHI